MSIEEEKCRVKTFHKGAVRGGGEYRFSLTSKLVLHNWISKKHLTLEKYNNDNKNIYA